MTAQSMAVQTKKQASGWQKNENIVAWLFAAPAVLLLLVFLVIPFIMAIWLSFTNQPLVPNLNVPTQFIGLRNFVRLFTDETFLKGLGNNFLFAIVVVPLQTSLALVLAVLVNQKLRYIQVFRTIYFIPVTITMVVVSVIWLLMYDASPEGVINRVVNFITFGFVPAQNWLGNINLVWPAIMFLSIWQGVGFQMVIYLAGLQAISVELYEAAQIDGANALQQFFGITVPQLRNTTIFIVISTTIFAFGLFTQVAIMTNGGPGDATATTVYNAFMQGFRQGKIGYGSAITVAYFVIVLTISLAQRFFMREERAVA